MQEDDLKRLIDEEFRKYVEEDDLEQLSDEELREYVQALLVGGLDDELKSIAEKASRKGLMNLVSILAEPELTELVPDPTWAYVEHWAIVSTFRFVEQELRNFLTDQEEVTPEADARLREYYRGLQSLCIRGLGILPKKDDEQ